MGPLLVAIYQAILPAMMGFMPLVITAAMCACTLSSYVFQQNLNTEE